MVDAVRISLQHQQSDRDFGRKPVKAYLGLKRQARRTGLLGLHGVRQPSRQAAWKALDRRRRTEGVRYCGPAIGQAPLHRMRLTLPLLARLQD